MLKRTLTALLLIPPVVYLIGWSPEWLFVLMVAAAVVLALREYFALCRVMGIRVFSWLGYVAGVGLCVAQILPADLYRTAVTPLMVALVLVIPIFAMRPSVDLKSYLVTTATTIFGIMYIGLTLACIVPIRFSVNDLGNPWVLGGETGPVPGLLHGARLVLFLFTVIWAGDICAYLVGRSVGRLPFFTRISPRKTWEGAIAGLLGSIIAGLLFTHWFLPRTQTAAVILLSLLIAVAGQIGDLVESAIKRGASQKDSGDLLPGHGGMLDRIDSLLLAAPAFWLALLILGCFS